jgi:hypothetical protein
MAMDPLTAGIGLVGKFIDRFVEDKDLKTQLKAQLTSQEFDADLQELKSRTEIIVAEAQGGWLQSNWRPLIMVFFTILIGLYFFGFAPEYLVENPEIVKELFNLLQIGIGGYIVGRSGEKIASSWNKQ